MNNNNNKPIFNPRINMLTVINWIKGNKELTDKALLRLAEKECNTSSLIFLSKIWKKELCKYAARLGDLGLLQYAISNGFEWAVNYDTIVAKKGDMEIIKWLHDKKLCHTDTILTDSLNNGNDNVLNWFIENKIPFDTKYMDFVIDSGRLDVVDKIVNGVIVSNWDKTSNNMKLLKRAAKTNNLDILIYLIGKVQWNNDFDKCLFEIYRSLFDDDYRELDRYDIIKYFVTTYSKIGLNNFIEFHYVGRDHIKLAAQLDRLDILKTIHKVYMEFANGREFVERLFIDILHIAYPYHLDILLWANENKLGSSQIASMDFSRPSEPMNQEIVCPLDSTLVFVNEDIMDIPNTYTIHDSITLKSFITFAVKTGDIFFLDWLFTRKASFPSKLYVDAIVSSKLSVITWATAKKIPYPPNLCSVAAEIGDKEALMFLRENDHEWNSMTWATALSNGHLELAQWIIYNGCPCDDKVKTKLINVDSTDDVLYKQCIIACENNNVKYLKNTLALMDSDMIDGSIVSILKSVRHGKIANDCIKYIFNNYRVNNRIIMYLLLDNVDMNTIKSYIEVPNVSAARIRSMLEGIDRSRTNKLMKIIADIAIFMNKKEIYSIIECLNLLSEIMANNVVSLLK